MCKKLCRIANLIKTFSVIIQFIKPSRNTKRIKISFNLNLSIKALFTESNNYFKFNVGKKHEKEKKIIIFIQVKKYIDIFLYVICM